MQERAEKYINMEENSRLGEASKSGFTYRDKDKESKKKEDRTGEKIKKYHNYTPLRVSLVDIYKEVCNTEKIPRLDHSKAKEEEETRMNIVNTIESVGTPPTNALT